MSAWEDFKTGATGIVSLTLGGATPVYGEPEGTTWAERVGVLVGAAGETAREILDDPSKVFEKDAELLSDAVEGAAGAALRGLSVPTLLLIGVGVWLVVRR